VHHAGELDQIVAAVESHSNDLLFLLLGFDGVLVAYDRDPEAVRLPSPARNLLESLASRPDVVLGIVSGRRAKDIKARTGLGNGVFYIGLHGLEAEGPDFASAEREVFDGFRDRLREIAATLEPSLSSVAGIRIEDKEAALAVHTREAGPVDTVWARLHLLNAAADLVNRRELRVVRGNHVFELVPNVSYPKAHAITEIRRVLEQREQRRVFTVYVGEDVADDDAFEGIDDQDVTAVVGRRGRQARYHLPSTAVVWRLIESLASVKQTPTPFACSGCDGRGGTRTRR
jgi:trehalose-phosphatase